METKTTINGKEIAVSRYWSASDVRGACIDNDLYTAGDNEQYSKMLNYVRDNPPTLENLYRVACDICEHSKRQSITNIMFILENNAVMKCFSIDNDF